ncbi:MAG: DUF4215 domain-containing protein [Myxococcota bacterium]|nr:DUF4215 domain-containing protein [Myxococcota bacterium]
MEWTHDLGPDVNGEPVRHTSVICLLLFGCQQTSDPSDAVSDGSMVSANVGGGEAAHAGPPHGVGFAESPGPIEPLLLGVLEIGGVAYMVGGRRGAEGGVLVRCKDTRVEKLAVPAGPMLWWVWPGPDGLKRVCGEGGRFLSERAEGTWHTARVHEDPRVIFWGGWTSTDGVDWVVGGAHDRFGPKGLVFHRTDNEWRQVDTASLGIKTNLYKVWGTEDGQVFIVGESGVGLTWFNDRLRRVDLPSRDLYFTIHGNRAGVILAVGGTSEARVARWDGDGWTAETLPAGSPPLSGVFVRPDGSAIAVGHRGSMMARSSAGSWTRLELDASQINGSMTLHAVFIGENAWAVGGDFTRQTFGTLLTDRRPVPVGPIRANAPRVASSMPDSPRDETAPNAGTSGGGPSMSLAGQQAVGPLARERVEPGPSGGAMRGEGGASEQAGSNDGGGQADGRVPTVAHDGVGHAMRPEQGGRVTLDEQMHGSAGESAGTASPNPFEANMNPHGDAIDWDVDAVADAGIADARVAEERCGDGVIDPGESCDDGNPVAGDGCDSNCVWECGNLRIDPGENCDDGNRDSDDGCSADCRRETTCGDGILSEAEECDDGNTTGNDGCSAVCVLECGNRAVEGREECDDGNRVDGDGCSSRCRLEPPGAGDWCQRPCLAQYQCLGLGGPDEPAICTARCDHPLDCVQAGFQESVCCQRIGFQLPDTYCIPETKLVDGCDDP